MDKIDVFDRLDHINAKVQFLKEALRSEYEAPLGEKARFGLHLFFDDIIDNIEAAQKEISASERDSILEDTALAKAIGKK